MQSLADFAKQPRGPYLVETWTSRIALDTTLGRIPIDLCCPLEAAPTQGMVDRALELAMFVQAHSAHLLDLIYAHYRYAESNDWLGFWKVPTGLARSEVLQQVDGIRLMVFEDLFASVHVDPRWDPEHKLGLDYDHGAIQRIDGQDFKLSNGELTFD